MKFPRISKKPEDLLNSDQKRLAVSRNIAVDAVMLLAFLLQAHPSVAAAVLAPVTPDQKVQPPSPSTQARAIRIGRNLRPYAEALRDLVPAQDDNHYSHYSHYSHESHYSHYSSSVPTPPTA